LAIFCNLYPKCCRGSENEKATVNQLKIALIVNMVIGTLVSLSQVFALNSDDEDLDQEVKVSQVLSEKSINDEFGRTGM